jgi:hypothetical protein
MLLPQQQPPMQQQHYTCQCWQQQRQQRCRQCCCGIEPRETAHLSFAGWGPCGCKCCCPITWQHLNSWQHTYMLLLYVLISRVFNSMVLLLLLLLSIMVGCQCNVSFLLLLLLLLSCVNFSCQTRSC